jgi:CRISPR-associated protein Cas5d
VVTALPGHARFAHPPLTVEVDGPYACFTRPEPETERVSYPVMTPSAARGVLQAIYREPGFDYVITAIEVLAEIRWASVRRDEVALMVTLDWVRRAMADPAQRFDAEAGRDQRNTVFLRDVAYRIRAQVRPRPHATSTETAYREQFGRRAGTRACFSQPFLGTRECPASFTRQTDRTPVSHTEDLGVMLHSITYTGGETCRWFDARLESGVMHVPDYGIQLATRAAGDNGPVSTALAV